ncbi:MAG: sigma 54-interacting transcriptional regulator [Alphaproteobacteria bacterium]
MHSDTLSALSSFLESLPEPHILCDRNHRILAANAAYRDKCTDCANIVGLTCYEVSHNYKVPCDQMGELCPASRCLRSGRREKALHLHHAPTGEIYEAIEVSPVRDAHGAITYYIEKLEELPVSRAVDPDHGLTGHSPAFRHIMELIARVAPSDAAVLLQGESGTGKELVARAIHDASSRAHAPFVVLDCSGLPETLFESELFGHEKGAFTGAVARQAGLVEAAEGGTLFLDEVGDIPLSMQVKLLRLLETSTYRRVGSTDLRKANFRLISATHRPLRHMAGEGSFRQDLYFRLNIFPIALPALRVRREDIPELAETLLRRVSTKRELEISFEAMRLLVTYDFPGNIRELRNIMERASLLCDGSELRPEHLPDEVLSGETINFAAFNGGGNGASALAHSLALAPTSAVVPTSWDEIQHQTLREVVAAHRGTRQALARKLGISVRTLYRRLAEARIDVAEVSEN